MQGQEFWIGGCSREAGVLSSKRPASCEGGALHEQLQQRGCEDGPRARSARVCPQGLLCFPSIMIRPRPRRAPRHPAAGPRRRACSAAQTEHPARRSRSRRRQRNTAVHAARCRSRRRTAGLALHPVAPTPSARPARPALRQHVVRARAPHARPQRHRRRASSRSSSSVTCATRRGARSRRHQARRHRTFRRPRSRPSCRLRTAS